jgi:MoaA/NifB/PqqE/SkfB family radical SAM enzyme
MRFLSQYQQIYKEIESLDGLKYISQIPAEFITQRKLENMLLTLKEERAGKVRVNSLPFSIIIEPTNVCNLKCPLCPTGLNNPSRVKGKMSLEDFCKLIDSCKDACMELFLQNWGEPTLLPYLPEMIKYAADNGIYVILSSNFSLKYLEGYIEALIASGLGLLHIDIDGTTQEVYEMYRRRGYLKRVMENTRSAVAAKKQLGVTFPVIQTNFLVTRHNEHQIESFRELSLELGVDEYVVGKLQVNPNEAMQWLPENKDYRYENYYTQAKSTEPCYRLWSSLTVNWDGNVSACCLVDDKAADYGSIYREGLKNVWNNDFFVSSRAYFVEKNQATLHTICHECGNQLNSKKLKRYKESFALMLRDDDEDSGGKRD